MNGGTTFPKLPLAGRPVVSGINAVCANGFTIGGGVSGGVCGGVSGCGAYDGCCGCGVSPCGAACGMVVELLGPALPAPPAPCGGCNCCCCCAAGGWTAASGSVAAAIFNGGGGRPERLGGPLICIVV